MEEKRTEPTNVTANITSTSGIESILSDILEVTLSGYWDWNIRDRTEFFSPAFKRMFGYEAHELPDIPETWQQLVHPDDLAQVLEVYTAHAESKGKVPFYNEVRYLHRDNSVKWMIFTGRIIEWDEAGNPVRMVGCHVDITERKHAEEQLRAQKRIIELNNSIANVFLTSPKQQIFKDALDVILLSLQSSYGYFGYINENGDLACPAISEDAMRSWQFSENSQNLLPRLVWDGIIEQSIKEKRTIISNDHPKVPEQHIQLTSACATPIIHHGQVIGQIFAANKPDGYNEFDRTLLESGAAQTAPILAAILEEKKNHKAHEKLEEQYRQAQKLESIGRLAGGVAHDLNNLLSPILGYGELLLEDLSPEDPRREGADQIVKAGHRAADLVRQLLAFSRKQTLEFKQIDLNNLLADFQKLLRRTIRENIAIDLQPRPFIPLIRGDIGQMEQVIMNLAVNAQDAMPEGGTLTIETSVQHITEAMAEDFESFKAGLHVCLSISDTGIGMSEETIAHIFEPFFTTKGLHEGTGLGLATVYGIIKQHNGNIQVKSVTGKGSTFQICLPCAEIDPQTIESLTNQETIPGGNESILLVEDNHQMLQLTKTVLSRKGYRVLTATNGVEALSLASIYNGPIHLLLTDVIMPELNGYQLFQDLVKKRPQLKVIYMSGYTGDVVLPHGGNDNNVQFIQKPFSVNVLSAKVHNALKGDQ
jgi:PAS domain S-box-containing protein